MRLEVGLSLILIFIFISGCTKEKIVTVEIPMLQKEAQKTEAQVVNETLKLPVIEEKISENLEMSDQQIQKFKSELKSFKINMIDILFKTYEFQATKAVNDSTSKIQFFLKSFMQKFSGHPTLKDVNRDHLFISIFQDELSEEGFDKLCSQIIFRDFIKSHITSDFFSSYSFLNHFIKDQQTFASIFADVVAREELKFNSATTRSIFERLLKYWTSSDDISPVTLKQIKNTVSWYEESMRSIPLEKKYVLTQNLKTKNQILFLSKEGVLKLDLLNRFFEKKQEHFDFFDSTTYRENVIDQQIFLNLTANLKQADYSSLDLSYTTLSSIFIQNPKEVDLEQLANKKNKLTKELGMNLDDLYRVSLIELDFARISLIASENAGKEKKLSLSEDFKNRWIKAYQLYKQNASVISWPPKREDNIFATETEKNGQDIFSLSLESKERLKRKLVSPGIYFSSGNTVLSADTLYFHPLTVILTNGHDLRINAKTVSNIFIDSGPYKEKNIIKSCARYKETLLPSQVEEDSTNLSSLPECEAGLKSNNDDGYTEEIRSQEFIVDQNLLDFLAFPKIDLDGASGKSSGSIYIKTENLNSAVLISKGQDGQNGFDGCDSKKFSNHSYEAKIKKGQYKLYRLMLSYSETEYDDYHRPWTTWTTEDAGICKDVKNYSEVALSLHRVEAGNGGIGGKGGDVGVEFLEYDRDNLPIESISIINYGGKGGTQGKAGEGPSAHIPIKDGASGPDGKTCVGDLKIHQIFCRENQKQNLNRKF